MSNSHLSKPYKIPLDLKISSNADIINELLFGSDIVSDDYADKWKLGSTLAVFVHSSVFSDFQNLMQILCQVHIVKSYDYELHVGNTTYRMKLVYVKNINENIHNFIINILHIQKFSLISEKPNLFICAKRFHELQLFIRKHHLEKDIVNIETRPGLICDTSGDTDITVVTFKSAWFDILENFVAFFTANFPILPSAYYQTIAFPWLQPSRIKHLRKPIRQGTYRVVHQFLICLRELSYDKEPHTNLFDLCNLKLAFCDDRGMNKWNADLVYEIDSIIIRLLNQLKKQTNLFANNQFNIRQYTSERDIEWNISTMQYFQYSYQDYFNSIVKWLPPGGFDPDHTFKSLKTIKLIDTELQDLEIIKQNSNTGFEIDCTNFAQMNIYTFINLLKYRNVKTVILDTNQKWFDSNQPKYLIMMSSFLMFFVNKSITIGLKTIKCFGKNTHNFVEHFLSALKKIPILPRMRFILNWPLLNYQIFYETRFSKIAFYAITIDSDMLEQLIKCKLNSAISLFECYLENDTKIWDLICVMDNLKFVYIVEEETTWQCLLEFVAKKLKLSNLKEFSLSAVTESKMYISNLVTEVDLLKYKFVMDSTNSKIVLLDRASRKELDLYYLKNRIADDKSEYDFYN